MATGSRELDSVFDSLHLDLRRNRTGVRSFRAVPPLLSRSIDTRRPCRGPMKVVMTLLVRDEDDIIEANLADHLRHGIKLSQPATS